MKFVEAFVVLGAVLLIWIIVLFFVVTLLRGM